jgi:sporulation protein YlmC with PRC-barrel domain
MKSVRWLSAAVATFALGSGGFVHAQTGQTGMHKADDDSMIVQPLGASVEDIEDMDIYGTGGDEVGEVEDVLVDGSGKAVAVTADVGGFLGVGEKHVVIGLDQLSKAGDRLTVAMAKEQIEALPEFDEDD